MEKELKYSKQTLTDICKELNIMAGQERNLRADVKYLLDCLKVEAHATNLISLGFDPEKPVYRKKLPFSATEYIYEKVFRQKN